MTLRRYSIQWNSTYNGWTYFDDLFWTRRGAAKKALKLVMNRRALCMIRVMKRLKGSDEEVLFIHRTAFPPYCTCKANPRPSRRTRSKYPK